VCGSKKGWALDAGSQAPAAKTVLDLNFTTHSVDTLMNAFFIENHQAKHYPGGLPKDAHFSEAFEWCIKLRPTVRAW
jgi:hypothetical protein